MRLDTCDVAFIAQKCLKMLTIMLRDADILEWNFSSNAWMKAPVSTCLKVLVVVWSLKFGVSYS